VVPSLFGLDQDNLDMAMCIVGFHSIEVALDHALARAVDSSFENQNIQPPRLRVLPPSWKQSRLVENQETKALVDNPQQKEHRHTLVQEMKSDYAFWDNSVIAGR
jgi:hypothetical protein